VARPGRSPDNQICPILSRRGFSQRSRGCPLSRPPFCCIVLLGIIELAWRLPGMARPRHGGEPGTFIEECEPDFAGGRARFTPLRVRWYVGPITRAKHLSPPNLQMAVGLLGRRARA
jgi:hypothetical protein